MTVVVGWGRKARQAKLDGDRVVRLVSEKETVINERVGRVNRLASRTEEAAVALIRQGDLYLEAAATRRH